MSINQAIMQTFGTNAGQSSAQNIANIQQEVGEQNIQQSISSQGAPFFVNRLEHAVGLSSLFDFINFYVKRGTPIQAKDNILILNDNQSRKFLMGRIRETNITMQNLKGDEYSKKRSYNPFLASYYDFLANTKWECAYIWQNRIYLLASKTDFHSYDVKQIPPIMVSIQVDDPSKFKKWEGENKLDIRKVVFKMRQESQMVNEYGQIMNPEELENLDPDNIPDEVIKKWQMVTEQNVNIPIQSIEDSYVEQTIPLMFLNKENSHLIYSAHNQRMKYEESKLLESMSESAENKISNYYNENAKLFAYYTKGVEDSVNNPNPLAVNNRNQQNYAEKEAAFAKKHGIDEDAMGWKQFREETEEERRKREESKK